MKGTMQELEKNLQVGALCAFKHQDGSFFLGTAEMGGWIKDINTHERFNRIVVDWFMYVLTPEGEMMFYRFSPGRFT